MRKVIYITILCSLLFVPLERVQIAQLHPVTAVAVRMENDKIVVETDGGLRGTSQSLAGAVEDLKINAPFVVYLDTAEYLLIAENALIYIEELAAYLKDSTKVCLTDAQDDLEWMIRYLDSHGDLPDLRYLIDENNHVKNN